VRAIFISYRREDAEGQAGRLFDDLVAHFGNDSVFMDVVGLEPGRDFRRAIDQQVASCGVLLALIGKNWLDAKNESGKRRLDDPMDFVRLETASALKRDIPVIPVLVRGASMPHAEDLPEDLKDLAFRNAVELTHARWDSDLQLLAKALTPYVQPKQSEPGLQSAASPQQRSRRFSSLIIFGGLVFLLLLALAGYLLFHNSSQDRNGPAVTTTATPTATAKATATAEPSRNVIQPISAPTLLSPPDGTEFNHYPRTVTLAWEKLPGAKSYKLEIQFESHGWNAYGQIKNTGATTYTFDFIGAQPGRWRVWGVDAEGKEGPKSEWWVFSFTQ
jgi:TIR domain